RIQRLPVGPIYPAVGAGSIWSGSAAVWEDEATQDDQVVRIDPTTLAIAERFHVGGNVSAVAFGFRSLCAALQTRAGSPHYAQAERLSCSGGIDSWYLRPRIRSPDGRGDWRRPVTHCAVAPGPDGPMTSVPTWRSVSSSRTAWSVRWANRSRSCSDSSAAMPTSTPPSRPTG